MDLKQLEYFVHVAEFGSFTRAAAFLCVAQPALSRQVRSLEVELRQPLFQRNGRGVTLTEAGKRLMAHGRGILQQVERAKQELEDQRGAAAGQIVVGLPPSVSRTIAVPLVQAFRDRFPRATLAIVEGMSTYILECLNIGRVDCGVVYNAVPAPTVDLAPLLDEPLVLVSSRSGKERRLVGPPVTLAALADYPLVIPSRPHSVRMRVETAVAGVGGKVQVALEIESVPTILTLVREGYGYAVLPLNAIRSSADEQHFLARPIVKPRLSSSLWLATSAQRPRGPLLQRSIELTRELVLRHYETQQSRNARSSRSP